jgi:hypothetical protein
LSVNLDVLMGRDFSRIPLKYMYHYNIETYRKTCIILLLGGLNTEEDDDVQIRKRRRSTSTESMFSPTGTSVPQVTYTTTMSNTSAISPKKITISKSPQAQPRVVASSSQTQKVKVILFTLNIYNCELFQVKTVYHKKRYI